MTVPKKKKTLSSTKLLICGFDEKSDYPKWTLFSSIPESKIDYDSFDELGIDD